MEANAAKATTVRTIPEKMRMTAKLNTKIARGFISKSIFEL
jgi:hypothetical protein